MCVWEDPAEGPGVQGSVAHRPGDYVRVRVTDCTQATLICELA